MEAYENILGFAVAREQTLDLGYLGMNQLNLQELDNIFTEKEVSEVIKELPVGFLLQILAYN